MANFVITTVSGTTIITSNKVTAKMFWYDGADVDFEDGTQVFTEKEKPKAIFPVWFSELEKDVMIAHWEKTGMFPTIVAKLRAAEVVKGIQ